MLCPKASDEDVERALAKSSGDLTVACSSLEKLQSNDTTTNGKRFKCTKGCEHVSQPLNIRATC
jgi:hypothetical protein